MLRVFDDDDHESVRYIVGAAGIGMGETGRSCSIHGSLVLGETADIFRIAYDPC
ncbi:Hypothetical protein AT6N2_L2380 [Agrobacterium tumefaciens]|nr:Hypothetical protein AT6N2_L2380 [Agrobacterium tumefaciens]